MELKFKRHFKNSRVLSVLLQQYYYQKLYAVLHVLKSHRASYILLGRYHTSAINLTLYILMCSQLLMGNRKRIEIFISFKLCEHRQRVVFIFIHIQYAQHQHTQGTFMNKIRDSKQPNRNKLPIL